MGPLTCEATLGDVVEDVDDGAFPHSHLVVAVGEWDTGEKLRGVFGFGDDEEVHLTSDHARWEAAEFADEVRVGHELEVRVEVKAFR